MRFSFIIPVYNRPDELNENLASLEKLDFKDFEVVIIEDGSTISSESVVNSYKDTLRIHYLYKNNEGPSIGRNFGANVANGEYLIFVDSDCIMPPEYLDKINENIKLYTDVFGGPDRAHVSFNRLQKAINFSMTSLVTTGGIRGQKKSVDRYYPRSFNLGIRRDVFMEIGGFPRTKMHPGEDMVLGIELINREYKTQYIHEAYVYHKRRTSVRQFFHQVRKFGKVRYYISMMYPHTFKVTYLLPVGFLLLFLLSMIGLLFGIYAPGFVMLIYTLLLFSCALIDTGSFMVAMLAVVTSYVQFFGYAMGITSAVLRHRISGQDEYDVIGKSLFEPYQP